MMSHHARALIVAAVLASAALQGFADDVVAGVVPEGALDLTGAWHSNAVAQVEDSLFSTDTDDSGWQIVQAPARWSEQKINGEGAPVVVYRRFVKVPAEWQGRKVGISAWFCAKDSLVYVNGQEIDPQGPDNALCADVSGLLRYGQENLIAVSTTVDGVRELAESSPPLLGPLGQRHLSAFTRTNVSIPAQPNPLRANLFLPDAGSQLPLVVFAATGHADYPVRDDWRPLNEDLARMGYASLAVSFNKFTQAELAAVLQYLTGMERLDHSRMAFVGAMKATRPVVLAAIGNADVKAVVLVSSARIPEIAQLGELPVLFICGDRESSLPALSAAREMYGALSGPHEIASLPSTGSGVALLDTSWNGLRGALTGWLDKHLRADR